MICNLQMRIFIVFALQSYQSIRLEYKITVILLYQNDGYFVAEEKGFEPLHQFPGLRDFESRLFDHLSTPPGSQRAHYTSQKPKNQGSFFAISMTSFSFSQISP